MFRNGLFYQESTKKIILNTQNTFLLLWKTMVLRTLLWNQKYLPFGIKFNTILELY